MTTEEMQKLGREMLSKHAFYQALCNTRTQWWRSESETPTEDQINKAWENYQISAKNYQKARKMMGFPYILNEKEA